MTKENDILKNIIGIGFCQPKFYKPTVWKYSKLLMERGIDMNIITPKDHGRGKGKYSSDLSYDDLYHLFSNDIESMEIVKKFTKYYNKININN